MKHLSIFPWSMDSEPAERIREEMSRLLGYRVYKVYANRGFEPEKGQAIIDWGRSDTPPWAENRPDLKWLNHPDSVGNSVYKDRTFRCMKQAGVRHVPFTMNNEVANDWLAEGNLVCARTNLRGHDGDGLLLLKSRRDLEYAPLYTKFIKGIRELRVYIFKDEVIDVLEKSDEEGVKSKDIRTEGNGWIYTRPYDAAFNADGCKQAVGAIKSCGLDFGGVDMLQDENGKWWVLETNTAPDVFGESVRRFCRGMYRWLEAL